MVDNLETEVDPCPFTFKKDSYFKCLLKPLPRITDAHLNCNCENYLTCKIYLEYKENKQKKE